MIQIDTNAGRALRIEFIFAKWLQSLKLNTLGIFGKKRRFFIAESAANAQGGLAQYWSGTQSAGGAQWQLSFSNGANQDVFPTNTVYVWALHEGNISAVPILVPYGC